ncbi:MULTISPECIES: arsenate reductase/protein-tyrosine-phosphatase family protein [unclassified Bifidobacterium]|uniref:arsenate reductase/protein-tyrosine-phosphatase family protein n=1 Tax=unclassified Bifidobacterium TaxID=2608897 RepID=UPI003F8F18D1
MRVMFVCTGNICRSPMGELLLSRYLADTSIEVSSAGTKGLPGHPIDPSSATLMSSVGIDSSVFRSRRLTRDMANATDLILCFEASQRREIVTLAPAVVRRTFVITEFAALCAYCADHGMVKGRTIQERLWSVEEAAPIVRPLLLPSPDIEDPHGRTFDVFCTVADETNRALRTILNSMRKHAGAKIRPLTQPEWKQFTATV